MTSFRPIPEMQPPASFAATLPERHGEGRRRHGARYLAQGATVAVAGAGLLAALAMDRAWADRHLLPDLLVPTAWLMAILQVERVVLVSIAAALLFVARPAIDRIGTGGGAGAGRMWLGVGLALVLAVPASQGTLWLFHPIGPGSGPSEPPKRADRLTGWVNGPGHVGRDPQYPTRPVYVLDGHGYRVASREAPVDTRAPSILFLGESAMFGKGLNWPDTIPGRVAAQSGIQSANLAVPAYSASQVYLQLRRELPRFQRPVAVVVLFGPLFLTRDLARNRPWIGRGGRWHPGNRRSELGDLGLLLFPYHSPAAIEATIATDRRLLQADVALARARGAEPLVLVPVYKPEQPRERELRTALFGGSGVPHVVVPLDGAWHLFPNFHPDARADRALADAAWTYLRTRKQRSNRHASRPRVHTDGRRQRHIPKSAIEKPEWY